MADTQIKLPVAALGTRETVLKVKADVVVTAADDNTSTLAVNFDKSFVNAPEVIGVTSVDAAVVKGVLSVDTVTATGMNVNIHQYLTAEVASGTYTVEVTLVGWKVS